MTNTPKTNRDGLTESGAAGERKAISPRLALTGVTIVIVVACILAAVGMVRRNRASRVLAETTTELAPPTVTVANPAQGAPMETLVLAGNVTAWTGSPIYARTGGYLTRWCFDLGARVKKGALLAEISAPELDQQLAQAEAELKTAEATANNARLQADRYSGLVKSDAVSHQDTDAFVNQAAATAAAVRSAEANLDRLKQLQSFEKIYAPFDGVITARNVDTGQLIDPGAGKELFHMQAIQTLRVYVNVPQMYSSAIKRGQKIQLGLAQFPGRSFEGTLARTAEAIDPVSRTLLVEVDVDNRAGELLPGSLAEVRFKTGKSEPSQIVPAAALIFRKEGMQVATVVNGKTAHLVAVGIGEDDGAKVQIATGLKATDLVIQDPPDSLIDGEQVRVVHPDAAAGGK